MLKHEYLDAAEAWRDYEYDVLAPEADDMWKALKSGIEARIQRYITESCEEYNRTGCSFVADGFNLSGEYSNIIMKHVASPLHRYVSTEVAFTVAELTAASRSRFVGHDTFQNPSQRLQDQCRGPDSGKRLHRRGRC